MGRATNTSCRTTKVSWFGKSRAGLEGYIAYWAGKGDPPHLYEEWMVAISRAVKARLEGAAGAMSPQGEYEQKTLKELQGDLAVLKEDRAPHNFALMCKKVYLYHRGKYVGDPKTFKEVTES